MDADPGDPSMMLVPPIQGFISSLVFSAPKGAAVNYTNFLVIIIEQKYASGLRLDRHAIQRPFHKISGTAYSTTYLTVSEGSHILKHDFPHAGFSSYLYGRGPYESYAFSVGMRLMSINTVRRLLYSLTNSRLVYSLSSK